MTETKWVAILHFSNGKDYPVPEKFETQEQASARVQELLQEEYLHEQKGQSLRVWRTAQVVYWEVMPEPWVGSPIAGGVAPALPVAGGHRSR